MIAVANDARKVLMETPALFWPVWPASSRAEPRSFEMFDMFDREIAETVPTGADSKG